MLQSASRSKQKAEIIACKAIIRNMFSKKYKHLAWIFYEPIDAKVLGLDDYHSVVKHPMDLSTVRYRLNANLYANAADFARDVRLIFYNTYLYTSPGHICYDMAKELQVIFENMFSKVAMCNSPDESFMFNELEHGGYEQSEASSSPAHFKDNTLVYAEYNTQMHQGQSIPMQMEELEPPTTADEDLELHVRVQQLDGAMLLNVIHMVRQMEGIPFGYANREIEFDVRNLKTSTKRSILAYMASRGVTGKRMQRQKRIY